jgi:hypothetical protein
MTTKQVYTTDDTSDLTTSKVNTKPSKYGAANPYASADTASKIKSQINTFTNPEAQRRFINKAAVNMASNVDGTASKKELANAMKTQKKNLGLTDEQAEKDDHNIVRKALHGITEAAEFVPQKLGEGADWVFDNTVGNLIDGSENWFDGDDLATAADIALDMGLMAIPGVGIGLVTAKNLARHAEDIGDVIAGDDYLTGEDLDFSQSLGKLGTTAMDTALGAIPFGKIGKGLSKKVMEKSVDETAKALEAISPQIEIPKFWKSNSKFADDEVGKLLKSPTTDIDDAATVSKAMAENAYDDVNVLKSHPDFREIKDATSRIYHTAEEEIPRKKAASIANKGKAMQAAGYGDTLDEIGKGNLKKDPRQAAEDLIEKNLNKIDEDAIRQGEKPTKVYEDNVDVLEAAGNKALGEMDKKTKDAVDELVSKREELLKESEKTPFLRRSKSKTGKNRRDINKELKQNARDIEDLVGKNELQILKQDKPDIVGDGAGSNVSSISRAIQNVVSPYGASLQKLNGSGFAGQVAKDVTGAGAYTLFNSLENGVNPITDEDARAETLGNLAFATLLGRARPTGKIGKGLKKYERGNKLIGNQEKRNLSQLVGQRMVKGAGSRNAQGVKINPSKKVVVDGKRYDPYALAQQIVQRQLTTDALKRIGDTYQMYSVDGQDPDKVQTNLQNSIGQAFSDYKGADEEAVQAGVEDMSKILGQTLTDDVTTQDTRSKNSFEYLAALMPQLNKSAQKHGYTDFQDLLTAVAAYQEMGE